MKTRFVLNQMHGLAYADPMSDIWVYAYAGTYVDLLALGVLSAYRVCVGCVECVVRAVWGVRFAICVCACCVCLCV